MAGETDVRVEQDTLTLGPVRVTFQRTLRIPESGLHYLPPGLGAFPLRRVSDYPDTAPATWLQRGGVMLPVYQREAMWLSFFSTEPAALQVGVGKVCAVSGERWLDRLATDPQNYAALPEQPWLDGINSGDGYIRQFVAVQLGLGATVEAQVTGEEVHGGVQLRAVGLTPAALAKWHEEQAAMRRGAPGVQYMASAAPPPAPGAADMGLGAGGKMRQEVYQDKRQLSDYDETRSWRVFVHLCSAKQWTAITGEVPPPTPVDRATYVRHGLPWFDYYDADHADLAASEELAKVKPVGDILGNEDDPYVPVDPKSVKILKGQTPDIVEPGEW